MTIDEKEELKKILASGNSIRVSFETISGSEKWANLAAQRNYENKQDHKSIKEWIINQVEAKADK